jgi:N-acetylmuramoyl-L-alanine amidase-like protein
MRNEFVSETDDDQRGRVAREPTIGTTGVVVLGRRAISASIAAALTAAVLTSGPRTEPEPRDVLAVPIGGLPQRSTAPFSMLGLTWDDPAARVDGTVQVRTRSHATGRWTGWQALAADGSAPGDSRGATDPLWVGASDGVQARVAGATRPAPTGLRVELIDPDGPAGTPESVPVPVAMTRPQTGTVPMPARPVPRMVTRAGWGADETAVHGAPLYGTSVQVFFVHHTATGNGYACADSPSIVRGIQAYQVRGKGWDDIGYNFLVDKCGTIFEGRAGGVGRPVTGAHTLGFNTDASAIAVIGDYGSTGVAATVRTAIATVAAYKLGAYGNAPNGTVKLVSHGSDRFADGTLVTLPRIAGHRDTGRTECPGDALYTQLGAIREIAGAAPYGLHLLRMIGSARRGSIYFAQSLVKPLWTLRTPSALINRFEVWVDGRLTLAAPGTHRLAPLRLASGGHTVAVRAIHLSGRATTITTRVLADPYAPVFTAAPDLALRTGSLNGTVPVRLSWAAADVNGLSSVALLQPDPAELGITAHARDATLPPGRAATFTLRATDRSGNARDASVTRTPVVLSEAAARRTGGWRTLRGPRYLGGTAIGGQTAGSTATWTFTGRSASLAVGRGADSGRVRIFVDDADQGVVDLRSSRTVYRQAVWSRAWHQSGTHTVRVEVVPTAGRTGAVLDGLVYLR